MRKEIKNAKKSSNFQLFKQIVKAAAAAGDGWPLGQKSQLLGTMTRWPQKLWPKFTARSRRHSVREGKGDILVKINLLTKVRSRFCWDCQIGGMATFPRGHTRQILPEERFFTFSSLLELGNWPHTHTILEGCSLERRGRRRRRRRRTNFRRNATRHWEAEFLFQALAITCTVFSCFLRRTTQTVSVSGTAYDDALLFPRGKDIFAPAAAASSRGGLFYDFFSRDPTSGRKLMNGGNLCGWKTLRAPVQVRARENAWNLTVLSAGDSACPALKICSGWGYILPGGPKVGKGGYCRNVGMSKV